MWKSNRRWEQQEAAAKLKVSQPYLSLIEAGKRPVTGSLAKRAVRIYNLPPTALPVKDQGNLEQLKNSDRLAAQLAALGYPKFSHLKKIKAVNPALVLIAALRADELESRLVEALPWVIQTFSELNWKLVIESAKLADAQNRLGFLIALALEKADQNGDRENSEIFKELLSNLGGSRLFSDDSFRRLSLTESEKEWLKKYRPPIAEFWRVLSNLSAEHI